MIQLKLTNEELKRILDWYYMCDPYTPLDHINHKLAKKLDSLQ